MSLAEQEVLRRYVEHGDADAFRQLVESHRDMVFSVCKRMLRNAADAEDAAQNCFLQLARKASSLKAPIAGWLHHVAVQISANMLKQNGRRAAHEARAATMRERTYEPPWEELKGALDDAIADLPGRLRIPIILHYLEGRTQESIAAELGVNQSTLSRRLTHGVATLRKRLLKKGGVLTAVALASLMAAHSVEAAPASLSSTIGKVALGGLTTGTKAAATAATIGGIGIVKIGIISTAAAAAVVTVGVVAHNALTQNPEPPPKAPVAVAQPAPQPASSFTYYDYTPMLQFCDNADARVPTPNEAEELGLLMPQVPWYQNAAYYYARAGHVASVIGKEQGWPAGSLSDVAPYAGDKQQFVEWGRANKPVMDAVKEGLRLAVCHCPPLLGPGAPMDFLLPFLAGFREVARRCADVGFAQELEEKYDAAAETYLDGLRMGGQMTRDGLAIDRLVGMALMSISVSRGLEGLTANHSLSDDTLRRIIAECRAAESLPDSRAGMWASECAQSTWMVSRPMTRAEWKTAAEGMGMKPMFFGLLGAPDQKQFLNAMRAAQKEMRNTFLKPVPEFLSPQAGFDAEIWRIQQKGGLGAVYARLFLPALSGVAIGEGKADAALRAMELRAALVLYERKNRKYPDKLADLVPDFLSIVPQDPFAQEPLRYERMDAGWKVWSIGLDLKDDGGVSADPRRPGDGPDYVFLSKAETNEQHRRDMVGPPAVVPPAVPQAARPRPRTDADFRNDLAALKDVTLQKEDPVLKTLTWYALKEGFAVADSESKEVKRITELLDETNFAVNAIAFGKDKVWLGTSKGLFAWDRKDMFWTRFAVGGKIIDPSVKELSLNDAAILRVTVEQDGQNRKFEYDSKAAGWRELE